MCESNIYLFDDEYIFTLNFFLSYCYNDRFIKIISIYLLITKTIIIHAYCYLLMGLLTISLIVFILTL